MTCSTDTDSHVTCSTNTDSRVTCTDTGSRVTCTDTDSLVACSSFINCRQGAAASDSYTCDDSLESDTIGWLPGVCMCYVTHIHMTDSVMYILASFSGL